MKKDHLKDIDFRSREERQKHALKEFKDWYALLSNKPYSDLSQGQLTMLSAVLWHLLPKNEYKKLVTSKRNLVATEQDIQLEIADELSWIV